ERDLADEIDFHCAMRQHDLEQQGAPRRDAEVAARRALGNATLASEDARTVWIWPWLESAGQDAVYALRNFRRQPGFTSVVVMVLATVIGLHTTLVSIVAGVVLRPWPGIRDAAGVVEIYLIEPTGRAGPFTMAAYRTLAEQVTSLGGVAASMTDDVRV